MRKETLLQPLVPLVAAMIGGLIAAGSAYLIQARDAELRERLWQKERLQERNTLYRTKLEAALAKVAEMGVVSTCITIEREKKGTPARCPIATEITLEVNVLVAVYAPDLAETANAAQESYFELDFFLEDAANKGAVTGWSDLQRDSLDRRLDQFSDDFEGFAESLVAEIGKYIPRHPS